MRFFFYGTLMAGSGNAVARAAHARLLAGVPAVAAGGLWAIPDAGGWYPALVLADGRNSGGAVRGFVHEAGPDFSEGDLAALDAWEGAEYRRCGVEAVLTDGACVMAQAYVWAGAVPQGGEAIADGDFAAFIAGRGLRAFGEDGS